jgi:hypothetical protein
VAFPYEQVQYDIFTKTELLWNATRSESTDRRIEAQQMEMAKSRRNGGEIISGEIIWGKCMAVNLQ